MRTESSYVPGLDTLAELEERARSRLPPMVFDWISGGAGDEVALRANAQAYRQFQLLPRVLTGAKLSGVSLETEVFNEQLTAPVFVAPMGGQKIVHPDGELATASVARETGIGYISSAAASYPLEEIAETAGVRWFQLYWQADVEITKDLIRRAEGAGYSALVLTVDTPVLGLRRRDATNDFHRPADVPFANLEPYGQADLGSRRSGDRASSNLIDTGRDISWDDVTWLLSQTKLPLLLKGVLAADDAVHARDAGVAGIVISNHGGRQLDYAPPTLDVLPEIRRTVGPELPLIVDGGVRHPADVLIARALGATAVGIGRPLLWALACGGRPLLQGMLTAFLGEVSRLVVQVGAASIAEVDGKHVRRANP